MFHRHKNLQEANLQRANLKNAELNWADLQEANLQEADLQMAKYCKDPYFETVFPDGFNLEESGMIEVDKYGNPVV